MDTYPNPYRNTKHEMRIVGLDDGAFHPSSKGIQRTILVAVLFRNLSISAVRVGAIQVDGTDANEVIGSVLRSLRYDVAMLSGISFGGFNVVDIDALSRKLRRPVIAITGERPHNQAVRTALRDHFTDWRKRWRIVRSAGRIYSYSPLRNEPCLYFEVQGGSPVLAKKAIASTAVISRLPEPIRVARILARGLSPLSQTCSP